MEFWKWSSNKLKLHTDKEFGQYLVRNFRMRWNTEYRGKGGKVTGYDFVIDSVDRGKIIGINTEFTKKKTSS